MSWNIGDNRNLFLKLKTKLGLYHVILAMSKSPKITLTIAEMQQCRKLIVRILQKRYHVSKGQYLMVDGKFALISRQI